MEKYKIQFTIVFHVDVKYINIQNMRIFFLLIKFFIAKYSFWT